MIVTLRGLAPGGAVASPPGPDLDSFEGTTALDIVQAMQQGGSMFTRDLSTDAYIMRTASLAEGLGGGRIVVAGDTPAERAESFLSELERLGLATIAR